MTTFKSTKEEITKERNRFEEYLQEVWENSPISHGVAAQHRENVLTDWLGALDYDEILDYAAAYTLLRVEETQVNPA